MMKMIKLKFDNNPTIVDNAANVFKVPKGIKNKEQLFSKYYHGLALPEYFGANWDALEEVLIDTSWMKKDETIIIHSDMPLLNDEEKKIYLDVLNSSIKILEEGPNAQRQLPQRKVNLTVYFPVYSKNEVERLIENRPVHGKGSA